MRKYSKVQFQSSIFASGVNVGNFLPAADKTFQELDMSYSPEGICIHISDTNRRIVKCEIIVPWANVVYAQLLPEEKKSDANTAK